MSHRPSHREARLKPEFAELYPPLDADQWIPAAVASARMLLWQTRQSGTSTLGQRTLDPRHFEFRGGVADPDVARHPGTRFGDHEGSDWPLRRQARLRAEFAELYPAVPPRVWIEASDVGASLLRWITGGGTAFPLGSRLLSEEHFEFRGGELPRGSVGSPRTRREDTPRGRGLAAG
jgi:hypothetical protein